jgi:hypothetical protein
MFCSSHFLQNPLCGGLIMQPLEMRSAAASTAKAPVEPSDACVTSRLNAGDKALIGMVMSAPTPLLFHHFFFLRAERLPS